MSLSCGRRCSFLGLARPEFGQWQAYRLPVDNGRVWAAQCGGATRTTSHECAPSSTGVTAKLCALLAAGPKLEYCCPRFMRSV
jgi:hypothetical protein